MKGLYDFHLAPSATTTVLELRDFGEEATSLLPKWRRGAPNPYFGQPPIEVADGATGFHETAGEIAGGWLGGYLGSKLPLGEFGKNAGRVAGSRIGRALGSKLDGPVPESIARGVLIPNERDYPGYWGYSGDDGLGNWNKERKRRRSR